VPNTLRTLIIADPYCTNAVKLTKSPFKAIERKGKLRLAELQDLTMLFFNSKNIPELAGLNFAERMDVIRRATDMLPVPTKITLNIVKLLILIPLFLLIARSTGWDIAAYAVLLVVLYPLIMRPLTFALSRRYFVKVRQQFFPQQG